MTKDYDPISFILKGASLAFGLVSWLIECVGPQYPKQILDPNEHPILTANVYSIWASTR
jgi:hypothetical protein